MEKLNNFVKNNQKYVQKIGTDFIAIILLGIPVLVLYLVGKPYERGFNCDDESIRYPYLDNTISSGLNYTYSTGIPILTIIIIEVIYYKQRRKKYVKSDDLSVSVSEDEPKHVDLFWQIYCRLSPFVFGALVSQMTTDIAKYSIGRLRPHFMAVCEPSVGGVTFRADDIRACDNYKYKYITDFYCTNTKYDEYRIRDSRLSFMSGHSSFASYCLIYLVIYLQVRLKWSTIGFLRPLYQALLIYLVIYTGFTRISDYKHHWSDVLIGLIQGTVVAILITRFVSDLFVKSNQIDSTGSNVGGDSAVTCLKSTRRQANYDSCKVEMEENTNLMTTH